MTLDFRKMSPEQIKDEISQLNQYIALLQTHGGEKRKEFYKGWGIGTLGAVAMSAMFPPVAMVAFTLPLFMTLQTTLEGQVLADTLEEARGLRAKFKAVYRARPGKRQFNLAARREREEKRKAAQGLKRFLPKFPGKNKF